MTSLKEMYDISSSMEYFGLGRILNALVRCKGSIVRCEISSYNSAYPRLSKAWIRIKVSKDKKALFGNITGIQLGRSVS